MQPQGTWFLMSNGDYALVKARLLPLSACYLKVPNIGWKTNLTRWVLLETKAIMSPPIFHWMESKKIVEEGEIINKSYHRR